jgi:polysaccharide export outer membrane protein
MSDLPFLVGSKQLIQLRTSRVERKSAFARFNSPITPRRNFPNRRQPIRWQIAATNACLFLLKVDCTHHIKLPMHTSPSITMTRLQITWTFRRSVLSALLTFVFSGCQSGLSYRAVDLPTELAARPVFSGQQFDLSQLGNTGAGADLIQPQDILKVLVTSGNDEDEPKESELSVTQEGTIDVSYVGRIQVAGLTESQAADAVRSACVQRQIFMRPSVSVMFAKKHTHHVTVGGAVETPGKYEIRASASTLATAVLAAGGLSEKASSQITVHQPGSRTVASAGNGQILQTGFESSTKATSPKILQVNLQSPATAQAASKDSLPDGTVITVREQPARYVTVMGLTGNRNIEMPYDREYRILDALAQAGGPRFSPWIANKLKIVRPHPQTGEAVAIRVRLGEAQNNREANIPLAPGDVVNVEETPLTFTLSTISALVGVGRNALTAGAF